MKDKKKAWEDYPNTERSENLSGQKHTCVSFIFLFDVAE